jgi:hypothetical protein
MMPPLGPNPGWLAQQQADSGGGCCLIVLLLMLAVLMVGFVFPASAALDKIWEAKKANPEVRIRHL